jgi:hypothetical protein
LPGQIRPSRPQQIQFLVYRAEPCWRVSGSEKSKWERFKSDNRSQFTRPRHGLTTVKQRTVTQVDPIKISDGHYAVHRAEWLVAPLRPVSDNSHDANRMPQKTSNYTSDGQ